MVRDFPEEDVITASATSVATAISVADGSLYSGKWLIEIDQETMYVNAQGSGVAVSVRRGVRGSTAASHASSSTVLINPTFYSVEILDYLNAGIDACFPLLYKPITAEYTGLADTTYEYTVPNIAGLGIPIPFLYRIDVQESGDLAFRQIKDWDIIRDAAPFIKFRRPLVTGSTIRLYGYGPFNHMTTITDTMDSFFPWNAEQLPVLYAAAQLLASGEAGRVRVDTGTVDSREQANAVGSSLKASQGLLQRFDYLLQRATMKALPPHVKSVI